jgi:putative transposase
MSANQAAFPVAAMARALGVSEAGHHAWRRRAPSARGTADAALLKRIRTVHAVSRGTCGAPRVHAELRAEGRPVGRKRVARLMRAAGLAGVSRRRGTRTATRRDAEARPAPDLVERDFAAAKPDQVWLADITLYLMAVPGRSRGTRPGQPGHFVRP